MGSSRAARTWQPGELKALRKRIRALPLDPKPTPETTAELEKGKAMRDSKRTTKH